MDTCTCRRAALNANANEPLSWLNLRRCNGTYTDAVALASQFDSNVRLRPRFKSERELESRLTNLDEEQLLRQLQPPLARQRDTLVAAAASLDRSRRPRTAILLVGAVRTMVSMRDDFASAIAEVGQLSSTLKVFAVLNRHDEQNASSLPRSYAEVDAAIARWNVPYELAEYAANGAEAPIMRLSRACSGVTVSSIASCRKYGPSKGCARVQAMLQYVHVEAATEMMVADESRAGGIPYDVVVRLRPDLCVRQAMPMLRFALERTRCDSLTPLHALEALMIYPRWAAHVYADYWRAAPSCARPDWALGCTDERRSHVGWLQREAGIVAFNLNQITTELGWTPIGLRRPWLPQCEPLM